MSMTAAALVAKALEIATEYKTLYVSGGFGAPGIAKNKTRYSKSNSYNKSIASKINSTTEDTFYFDCCGLIKGILWGWNGDTTKTYGGATYVANGVPDAGAYSIMNKYCTAVSTDFSSIAIGEAVWLSGDIYNGGDSHIGIYVGDGHVVESTPKWENGVQLRNLSDRKWEKHGYLPWVDYSACIETKSYDNPKKTIWKALHELGYDDVATAAIMGNMQAESAFYSNNLQNSGNSRLGITDAQYTFEVDNGSRNFIDNIGYGLCQWTSGKRKQRLLDKAKALQLSVSDIYVQCSLLDEELKSTYKNKTLPALQSGNLEEAAFAFMYYYEAPAARESVGTRTARIKNAQAIYNEFHVEQNSNMVICPHCGTVIQLNKE